MSLYRVPDNAKILVIGDAPEKGELSHGVPFSSATRQIIKTAIKEFGMAEHEVAWGYASMAPLVFEKGKPQRPKPATMNNSLLEEIISRFKGRVILCVGVAAFERIMGAPYRQLLQKSRSGWDGYAHPMDDVPARVELGRETWHDPDDPIKSGPNKGEPRPKRRALHANTPVQDEVVAVCACLDPHTVRLQGWSTKVALLRAVELACQVALGARPLEPDDLAEYNDWYVEHPTDWNETLDCTDVELVFDIENDPEHITYISFAELMPDGSIRQHASFNWTPATAALATRLLGESSPYPKRVAHNLAYDAGQLLHFEQIHVAGSGEGEQGAGLVDTMMAAHIIHPDLPKGLGAMWRYMPPMRPTKHLEAKTGSMRFYNLIDSMLTAKVRHVQRGLLQRMGQNTLLRTECASIMVLDRMTRHGLPVDRGALGEWIEKTDAEVEHWLDEWWVCSGLKVTAGKAVTDWVFKEHGAPLLGTTATGKPQLTAEIMEKLIDANISSDLTSGLTALMKAKKLGKLVETYGRGFLEKLDAEGYLHPSYLPDVKDAGDLGTAAGRLSSSPNVQNVPKSMRWIFRAPDGYVIGDSDLSAVEGRVQAILANDLELLEMYDREGWDMHTYNLENARARLMEVWTDQVEFGNSARKKVCRERLAAVERGVWPVIRKNMKTFLYGWNYGAGDRKIASSLNLHLFEAMAIREAYEASRPATRDWRKAVVMEAATKKYLQNAFGRVRYFYGVVPDTHVRNQAINFFPQSTVADMFWTWFPQIESLLKEHDGHLITQVHDSFVYMYPDGEQDKLIPKLDELMGQEWPQIAPGFRVPSTHEVGASWGECEPYQGGGR